MFFQPFPSFLPFVSYPRSRQDVENDEAEIAMDIEEWTLGTLVQSYGPVSVLNNFFQYLNNRVVPYSPAQTRREFPESP